MITIGKYTYFENAPWILNQQGSITPQALDVSQWVPENAVRYGIQVTLFRSIFPQTPPHSGYVDSAVVIRLPGYTDIDYAVVALVAGQLQENGYLELGGMGEISIPNINRTLYWLNRGSTLQYGANVSMSLLWYELP